VGALLDKDNQFIGKAVTVGFIAAGLYVGYHNYTKPGFFPALGAMALFGGYLTIKK